MNLRAEGVGLPHAHIRDRLLSVCSALGFPSGALSCVFLFSQQPDMRKSKALDVENVLRMEITMSKPMVLHADGGISGRCNTGKPLSVCKP